MIAVAYARTSTIEQSTDTQVARLYRAAAELDLVLAPERIFVDDGISGRTMARPGFDQVVALVRSRSAEVVLTTKFDRLGRSARGILDFFELADINGVRVVCVDQSIDTSTPSGKFIRTIFAGFAELEADLIRERTRDRLAYLSDRHSKTGVWETKSGRPVGRPPRLTPEILAEVIRIRESGRSWAEVAQHVHVPATSARKWYANAKRAARTPPTDNPRVIIP